jgi:arsenite methyltransferase
VERESIRDSLRSLSALASAQPLLPADAAHWRDVGADPDDLIDQYDFCFREMYVVTSGRR